jgi:iron complex transport system substrate-binding protein
LRPLVRPFRSALLVVIAAALLLGACGGGDGGRAPAESERPERIVTLAPNLTEIVFELGLGDRVVGVSEYASWPPEVEGLPRLGGLFDPNLEGMIALEPDLAILLSSQEDVARHLAGVRVPSRRVGIETVGDLERAVREIAERCGVPEAGEELATRLARELAPRPVPGAPPAVIVLDDDTGASGTQGGLLVAGPGTFYQELLERLGSENVFADAPMRYPVVGMEEILGRGPRAIVQVSSREMPDGSRERLAAEWRRRYPTLPAAARGGVYLVAARWSVGLGPRTPKLYSAHEEAHRRAAADRE